MNCDQFQNELHEYLEDSLPPGRRRNAAAHLAECAGCRLRLASERTAAQALARKFHSGTQQLTLPPDFAIRLQTVLEQEHATPAESQAVSFDTATASIRTGWRHLLWPAAIAVCVLLTSFRSGYFFPAGTAATKPHQRTFITPPDISVRLVYSEPRETFRRDSGRVVDDVEYEPSSVEINFHRADPHNPL